MSGSEITAAFFELQLEPGSKLFVYSDGLPEANDMDDRLFGVDRTLKALNDASDLNPEATLNAVTGAVNAFVGDAPQFDDLTMLCLAYYGPGGKQERPEPEEGENNHAEA